MTDPFGTGELRSSVLRAWRESPTRFTEDTNSERDLRVGGYRDRLFVELAQNAADAGASAGSPARVRVSLVDGELRVANTGAPLDRAGVAALSSLRASAKPAGNTVGRFGVGFAAVLAVTDEPRIVSRTGSIAFSLTRTRTESGRSGEVPVLRLPWPVAEAPPDGFDTEVRLPLRSDVDAHALLDGLRHGAEDLLLALHWLESVDVDGAVFTRMVDGDQVEIGLPGQRVRRWLTSAGDGFLWAVPVGRDGKPEPLAQDVLHAPTPTDERLSLPARLIASVPIEPSRRRVLAGDDAVRDVLAAAAAGYPALARKIPAEHRLALVPEPGFPLSEVDESLRELVTRALADTPWVPSAHDGPLAAGRASVLTVDAPELVDVLAEVVPGLAGKPLCGAEAARLLGSVGASTLTVDGVVAAVTGVDRPPFWWRELYAALLPAYEAHAIAADELGALPVPLTEGRTVPGPRGALLVDPDTDGLAELAEAGVLGLRLVHPDAGHPLLERLGAVRADAGDLLESPALADAVERSVPDARAGIDVRPLWTAVLRLVARTHLRPDWLGALALPSADGWRRADELVLPGAPLLDVLDPEAVGPDAPLDVLDAEFAAAWDTGTLTAAGVLDTFAVVADDEPTGPDHDLPDEDEWWAATEHPPGQVLAVRDLDLVADDAWPAALELLAARPETWQAWRAPGGHTAWWIARYALLAGRAPVEWRLPGADALAGLYDPVPGLGVRTELLALAGVRAELSVADADDVTELLERLGDPARAVRPGLTARTYAALAQVPVDPADLDPPARVRNVDGEVVDAARAVVLDQPWLLPVCPRGGLVVVDYPHTAALADLLDLPLASERYPAEVVSDGEWAAWTDLPAVVAAAELLGLGLPEDGVHIHDPLEATVDGVIREIPWWHTETETHAADTPQALAKALAWRTGHWKSRHLLAELIEDPDPTVPMG